MLLRVEPRRDAEFVGILPGQESPHARPLVAHFR